MSFNLTVCIYILPIHSTLNHAYFIGVHMDLQKFPLVYRCYSLHSGGGRTYHFCPLVSRVRGQEQPLIEVGFCFTLHKANSHFSFSSAVFIARYL